MKNNLPIILDSTAQEIASTLRKISQDVFTIYESAGYHNSHFRGKSLGSTVTNEQKKAIANGTFDDLFIGDYWTINDINWRIAHFNYWSGSNHIVIVPDTNLATEKMNSSNTTAGGYIGSGLYTGTNADSTSNTGLATAKTAFESAFGSSHIYTHKELLSNAVTSGVVSGVVWKDSGVELMSEQMVYGHSVWAKNGKEVGSSKTQLALFNLAPVFIQKQRSWYWLRSVYSGSYFCYVNAYGPAYDADASYSLGVRPAAAIYFDDVSNE